jgi:hypothetical protein
MTLRPGGYTEAYSAFGRHSCTSLDALSICFCSSSPRASTHSLARGELPRRTQSMPSGRPRVADSGLLMLGKLVPVGAQAQHHIDVHILSIILCDHINPVVHFSSGRACGGGTLSGTGGAKRRNPNQLEF